ncbi:MAG TPA: ABC transporter permease [Gammaproteobacteria bacterium]|nr:ABC transporter permease [Gammaproteobacteria bacterium]
MNRVDHGLARGSGVASLVADLRHGFRSLVRHSRFTALIAVTLGLGIGAGTAVFAVLNAVVLQPLPFRESARLVRLWSVRAENPTKQRVSYPDLRDWQAESRTLDLVGYGGLDTVMTGTGEPERLHAELFLGDLFSLLGVSPSLGAAHLVGPSDEPTVILSHELWRRRFDASPSVVGTPITLDGKQYIVAAVMPAGFQFPIRVAAPVDLWIPLKQFNPALADRRGARLIDVIGRLRSGVALEQAQAEMDLIASRLSDRYPDTNESIGVRVMPALEEVAGDASRSLLLVSCAVGLLLLIGCANVASLLLARTAVREKEIALRAALGASGKRLARQLLIESLLLGLVGGVVGCFLADCAVEALRGLFAAALPRADAIAVNGRVVAFATMVSLATAVLFGPAPAAAAARTSLARSLQRSGQAVSRGTPARRLCQALVVGEIALATLLLVGAGSLVHSFWNLRQIGPGFDPRNVLTLEITWPAGKYTDPAEAFARLRARLLQIPGVSSASTGLQLPSRGEAMLDDTSPFVRIEGAPASPERQPVARLAVQPGFFRTLGIPLTGGRDFGEDDRPGTPRVAIVNEALARAYLFGEDPIGKRLSLDSWVLRGEGAAEIVGVAGDATRGGAGAEAEPIVYLPFAQSPAWSAPMVVKTHGDPLAFVPLVRDAVHAIDPDEPIDDVETLEQRIGGSLAGDRWRALLLALFAAVAEGLAGAGLYAVLSYLASQRTREVGIRLALGARTSEVFRTVLGQGIKAALLGMLIGLAGLALAERLAGSALLGVTLADPAALFAVTIILLAVAALASGLPARRAARIHLVEILKSE